MKNMVLNLKTTCTIARFAEAFEVYLREYNCKSESEIKTEKAKFNHCLELGKIQKVGVARADESATEEPDED